MKKTNLVVIILLIFIASAFAQEKIYYLPINPRIVSTRILTIKQISSHEKLVEIQGVYEPIKTKVHQIGNRSYFEKVDIKAHQKLGELVVDTGANNTLLNMTIANPGKWQALIITTSQEKRRHPSEHFWLKKRIAGLTLF